MSSEKSRSESNLSKEENDVDKTLNLSSDCLTPKMSPKMRKASTVSQPLNNTFENNANSETPFSNAADVDGKINYIRRLSKNYGYPLDVFTKNVPHSVNGSSYVNEAYLETPTKNINETQIQNIRSTEMENVALKFNGNVKNKHHLKINIPENYPHFELAIDGEEPPERMDCIKLLAKKITDLMLNNALYMKIFVFILYNIYLGFAMWNTWEKTESFCKGVKFLFIATMFAYLIVLYYLLLKKKVIIPVYRGFILKIIKRANSVPFIQKYFTAAFISFLVAAFIAYSVFISRSNLKRLSSVGGICGFVFIGYLLSSRRSHINWKPVFWGLSLQFLLALFVMRTSFGKVFFACLGDKVTTFLDYTDSGSGFVFGYLVTGKLNGTPPQVPVLAFKVFSVIIFFSFFTSILYYYGVMQIVVSKVGWLLHSTIGTTACESLSASANIFLGMAEAPLLVKPYLPLMTKSELFTVMTGGFATIAGSVLAAYVSFGVSASHLISASVMAAPCALGLSKLFYPETCVSKTNQKAFEKEKPTERNALEAGSNGACQAVIIISNIVANLIAIIAFVYFIDQMFSWFGSLLGADYINFEWLLSKLFIPFALMMGTDWNDAEHVAKLIGLKTVVNEFVAYKKLVELKDAQIISKRAEIIATYALCGFSNLSSIGIQIGALGGIVPERKPQLAQLGFKAMIAGSTVTFISACIAGLLVDETFLDVNQMNETTTIIAETVTSSL